MFTVSTSQRCVLRLLLPKLVAAGALTLVAPAGCELQRIDSPFHKGLKQQCALLLDDRFRMHLSSYQGGQSAVSEVCRRLKKAWT